jgi:enoyl-CoA hydratase
MTGPKTALAPGGEPDTVSVVVYNREGPLGFITINRPEKLNAMNDAVVDAMGARLREAAADDEVKVLLIAGAGSSFSSGFDLVAEANDRITGAARWHQTLARDVEMTMALWSFPKPTVAVVRGWCLAGACELAMACDMIIAADDARFGEPEIRYGSGPVTLLMPFVLGQKKTNELLFTGNVVDALEAERLGLVNKIAPSAQVESVGRDLATRIALAPLEVLKFTKLALKRAWQAAGLEQAVQANLDLSAILNSLDSPEQQEFDRIVNSEGLRAALAWRDGRYGAVLGEP